MTDVATTPRKKFSRKQRLTIFEAHGGICVLCKRKITDSKWIVEHVRPLVLGGSNDMENLGPAHNDCADKKTNGKGGDLSRGAKAKRQKMAKLVRKEPDRPIESRGFPEQQRPPKTGTARIKKQPLRPKQLFVKCGEEKACKGPKETPTRSGAIGGAGTSNSLTTKRPNRTRKPC